MVTQPKLTYYELRGRAEAIRLLLIDQGVDFVDERLNAEAWRTLKPTVPFRQLPVFEDQYGQHGQAAAILRHLARTQVIETSTEPLWWTKADQVHEALAEAQESLWRFAWEEAYQTDRARYTKRELRHYLKGLASLKGDSPFFTRTAVSHVDYLAAVYPDEVTAFFGDLGSLGEFHQAMYARPLISEYVNSGRRPIVFGMGLDGPKYAPESSEVERAEWPNPWADS